MDCQRKSISPVRPYKSPGFGVRPEPVPHNGSKPAITIHQSKAIGGLADDLLARLKGPGEALSMADFEMIIADAIVASGVTSVSHGGLNDEFVDMAVWSQDLLPWVVNPLPIQLRCRVKNASDLSAAAMRLLRQLSENGMKWGLLIYLRSEIEMANVWLIPNLLSIKAEQFIEALRTVGFGDLIRKLRNDRVHGVR
jgi:hypothetical protein